MSLSMEDKIWIQRQINRAVSEATGKPMRDPLEAPEEVFDPKKRLEELMAFSKA